MRGWSIVAAIGCGAGCAEELPVNRGTFGGQVVVSGGLRGARVTINQLDFVTGEIRIPLGETVTDEAGRFSLETGTENGLIHIVARGGAYEDLATGATVYLDDTDHITSLVWRDLLDVQDGAVVSPIGHLIEARTKARLPVLGKLRAAFDETAASFNRHFGDVRWGEVRLHPLDLPAVSPTEPVRAAFVHAALSVLARDIAADAGAGPQEVTVYRLMQRWTEDIRAGTFDGNDRNSRAPGSGLQLGSCPPVDPACVVPDTGCTAGHCRRLCDLYAGTARALLAGAMAKVIGDRGPGGINQTGLDLPNTLSIVRAVADNADPALFDSSCVEELDRTPPLVRFEPPTPGAAGFVRGSIQVKAVAVDDLDARPHTSLVGLADLDGDPGNAAALAMIDTSALADGPLTVVARATDRAGNTATLERVLTIDNTAPAVTIDPTGFFVDGTTWWTASATPALTGMLSDGMPASVKAVFPGGIEVAGSIAGSSWMILLPPGLLEDTGTLVQIVATDAAGNQRGVAQRIRPDLEAPVLSFSPSTVNDEAAELVTFAADHSPQHAHTGAPVDLAVAGACPSVTKFSYLLGSTAPEYAAEAPGPNPIRYQLVTDDPGVGIAPGSTEYRVGRRVGAATEWLLDWTSAGAGVPLTSSARRFPVAVSSDVVAGLATTESIYDVELRATDRLARTTTVARCFDLHLRAPPLELEAASSGPRATKDHTYALDSLSLADGAPHHQIAARLLNADATGASLIDQDVFNGTPATVFLTVTVTKPDMVVVEQSFVMDNAITNVSICVGVECNAPVPSMLGPKYDSPTPAVPIQETTLHFPVKVFEVVGGVPATEIPCLGPCPPGGSVFEFAIPPRATGAQPARMFRVMTMIGQVSSLRPSDGFHTAIPPFADEEITWASVTAPNDPTTTHVTGIVDHTVVPERTGCVKPAPGGCYMGTAVPYRALRSVTLTFASATGSRYETAATAALPPVQAIIDRYRLHDMTNNWTTSAAVLPNHP